MMIELDIDKPTSFSLEMQIDGDVSKGTLPKMRFCIESEDFVFSVPAVRVDNGVYEINCPRLKGILEAGEYNVKVEVVIDDKIFYPLEETIRVKEAIKPTVKLAESVKRPAAAPAVSVKVGKPVIQSTPKLPSISKTEDIVTIR